jgi:hypothetical protein
MHNVINLLNGKHEFCRNLVQIKSEIKMLSPKPRQNTLYPCFDYLLDQNEGIMCMFGLNQMKKEVAIMQDEQIVDRHTSNLRFT